MPGVARCAVSRAAWTEPSCDSVGAGVSRQGRSNCCTSVRCQMANSGVDNSFSTPVTPTTSAQASVTTPSRLCRSSHFKRRERSRRTVPNSSFRVNGPYSTMPEMIAITNSSAMLPRKSSPGSSTNKSRCRLSITPMKVGCCSAGGFDCSSILAVRASKRMKCSEWGSASAAAQEGAIDTKTCGSSSSTNSDAMI